MKMIKVIVLESSRKFLLLVSILINVTFTCVPPPIIFRWELYVRLCLAELPILGGDGLLGFGEGWYRVWQFCRRDTGKLFGVLI